MKIRVNVGVSAALGLMIAAGLAYRAQAQFGFGIIAPNAYGGYTQTPTARVLPNPNARQGDWAEVITATPKWLVVQNEQGQQFPIPADGIRQFLIRWPSSAADLTPQSLVEVNGLGLPNNGIAADHIDVYEDAAQSLVSPSITGSHGYVRNISGWDVDQLNTQGITNFWTPQEWMTPNQMSIVGNPIATDPVRISVLGTNLFTILPGAEGMSVTQITLGSPSYARRGDLVYVVSDSAEPRGLNVSRLVLYKKVAMSQFAP